MERIENQMTVNCGAEDSFRKVLEICENCKCEMKHGDKFYHVWNVYFCEDCVETGELDESDY
jgi:hypothetical protein